MDAVLSGLAIYVVLLLIFRLAGKRSLSQATTSDLLVLLFLGEATQQALQGRDFSLAVAAALIVVLLGVNRLVDHLSARAARENRREVEPMVLVDHGEPLHERMGRVRVTPEDVMVRAREAHGLESMDEIQYAVLERHGGIVIVPRP